jgi:hypothetical protein
MGSDDGASGSRCDETRNRSAVQLRCDETVPPSTTISAAVT